MNLAGFFGQKLNGKGKACNVLKDILQEWYFVHNIAFADEMKNTFCNLFGVSREWIEEWKEKLDSPPGWEVTVRKALQMFGDGLRQIKSDVWVKQIEQRIETQKSRNAYHLINDGRHYDELKKTHELGGISVLLYRPGFLNDIDHPSENQVGKIIRWFLEHKVPEGLVSFKGIEEPGVDFIDLFLVNDGTEDDLEKKIKKYLGIFIGEKHAS